MANGVQRGDGLASLGIPLFTCELEGGAGALSTQLVELRVVAGDELLLVAVASGGGGATLAVVWGEPAFLGPEDEDEVSLLQLDRQPLASVAGETIAWRSEADGELLLGGRPCDAALLMRTPAAVRVRVPPGREWLVAECGFDGAALPGPLVRARCSVYGETPK
jgi:hypothetical protein